VEEIDLSVYIDVLIKYWKWMAGITVVAAITAAIVSFVLPPVYQATALVVITKPQYQMQFDPRFQTVPFEQRSMPFKAYAALATNSELLEHLSVALESHLEPEERMGAMEATTSKDDPSLIELTVNNSDPDQATLIANTWADLYIQWINELYEASGQDKVFFEQQLDAANANLQTIEEEIITFQAENRVGVIQAQLEAKKSALANYLAVGNALELIVQDARALQERLKLQGSGEFSSSADDLAALLLNIEAFGFVGNGQSDGEARGVAIQLQVPNDTDVSSKTVRQQIEYLDNLIVALGSKAQAMKAKAEAITPDILSLQKELQAVGTEEQRLERARKVADEVYLTLSRKYEEARIAAEDESGQVRLASKARVPKVPVAPNKTRNVTLGAGLGLVVGIFGAFAAEYLRGYRTRNSKGRE
jgi:succinoglycan biosynthesis transport protein ExoP